MGRSPRLRVYYQRLGRYTTASALISVSVLPSIKRCLSMPGWKLAYYEAYLNEQDARDRERMLKQYGAARGHLKQRIGHSTGLESAG